MDIIAVKVLQVTPCGIGGKLSSFHTIQYSRTTWSSAFCMTCRRQVSALLQSKLILPGTAGFANSCMMRSVWRRLTLTLKRWQDNNTTWGEHTVVSLDDALSTQSGQGWASAGNRTHEAMDWPIEFKTRPTLQDSYQWDKQPKPLTVLSKAQKAWFWKHLERWCQEQQKVAFTAGPESFIQGNCSSTAGHFQKP